MQSTFSALGYGTRALERRSVAIHGVYNQPLKSIPAVINIVSG
jgi:hypothetical protein